MKRISLIPLFALMIGCATIPGKTRQAQVQTVDDLVQRTLQDLYKQHPLAKEEIEKSVGYAILDNKLTKVPVFGAGGGYGVAIDSKTHEKTYLRMSRIDFGGGWGARSVRPVLIFQDEHKFRHFIDGVLKMQMGAEAAAKVGDAGAAGGAGSQNRAGNEGFKTYVITDAGVSATVTLNVIRVKPVKLKKEKAS